MVRLGHTACACAALLAAAAASSFAAEVVFDRSVHRGDCPVDYIVTVNDTDAPGYFRFTVQVDNTDNVNIADITAIYLEFAPEDFDAADWYDPMPGVDFIQRSDAILRSIHFNTYDVGNGNIVGNGNLFTQFDIGIAIGESNGIDGGDDYQIVVFDMAIKAGLTLDDLAGVGVRGQSVGPWDGSRTCSSKEFVLIPCPGDFNSDGFIDTRDVLLFLNMWTTRDPSADFNGDGIINTLDLIAFFNAWEDAYLFGCG